MEKGLTYSILMHTALFVLMVFGLPHIMPPRDFEPTAISVELLPISELSNVKPSPKPVSQKPPKPSAKPKKAVPRTTTSEKKQEIKKPVEAVKLPDPKKPQEKEKPEEKKEATKPKEETDSLDAVLKSVEKTASETEEKDNKPPKDANDSSKSKSENYDASLPLSLSEKDSIKSQFIKCWRMPAGARNAHELAVLVKVLLYPDGSVQDVGLHPSQVRRYQTDTFFRAAADSAIRAVWQCNPITGLPPEKFNRWKDLELNFDPSELLY